MTVGVSVGRNQLLWHKMLKKLIVMMTTHLVLGTKDMKSTNFGVTYAVTDSLTLEAASVAAQEQLLVTTDYKYDESAYGIAYTVASGVTLTASYSDFTQSGGGGTDVSGSGTTVS